MSRDIIIALSPILVLCMTVAAGPVLGDIQPMIWGNFEAAGLTEGQVCPFLESLQAAVRRRDAAAVSTFASFPLSVTRKTGSGWVRSKAEFVKQFPSIFDPDVRKEVLSQRCEELFASSHGVTTSAMSVWFMNVCDPNEPPGACKKMRILMVAVNLHGR